jgi:hypothetical protein
LAQIFFCHIGSPLRSEFSVREDDLANTQISISESSDQYLCARMVDGKRHITVDIAVGTHDALLRRGIRLPRIGMELAYKKSDSSQVLYIAFDRRFRLAYAAEYRISRRFADAVRLLDRIGFATSLVAYDPLVRVGTLETTGARRLPEVCVTRSTRCDDVNEGIAASVVATDRCTDLALPLAACYRMRRAYRLGEWLNWLFVVLALFASLTAVCLGGAWLLGSISLMLYQVLCTASSALLAAAVVNHRPDKQKGEAAKPHVPTPDAGKR